MAPPALGARLMRPFTIQNKWLVLVLAILLQMVVFGTFIYSFTFWVEPWAQEFSVSRTTILMISTIYLYATSGVAFLLGGYIDKLPQRLIAGIGLGFYVLSMLMIAVAPTIGVIFLAYTLLVPVATTLAGPIAAMVFVAQVFDRGRGFAIGLVTMGTSLGGMTVPMLCAALIESVGWRQTHILLALISLVLFPAILLIMKYRPQSSAVAQVGPNRSATRLDFLRRRELWVCIISFMLAYFVFISIQFNMAPLVGDMGIGLQGTAAAVSVLTFCMIVGKLLTGFISDKVDTRLVFVGICTLLFLGTAAIALRPPFPVLLVAFGLLGLGSGGLIPLKGALMADIFGPENVGKVLGTSAPFIAAYGFGPIYAGWIRDTTGSYDLALYTLVIMAAAAAPLIFLLRVRTPRRQ